MEVVKIEEDRIVDIAVEDIVVDSKDSVGEDSHVAGHEENMVVGIAAVVGIVVEVDNIVAGCVEGKHVAVDNLGVMIEDEGRNQLEEEVLGTDCNRIHDHWQYYW